jgi:hypothetical protein
MIFLSSPGPMKTVLAHDGDKFEVWQVGIVAAGRAIAAPGITACTESCSETLREISQPRSRGAAPGSSR